MGFNSTVVPPHGPTSADLYIVGEAPGAEEARLRRPFCGPSGQYQAETLRRYGVDIASCRLNNVVGLYLPGNPDPSPALIAEYGPKLEADVARVRPLVVLCVGRFAMRYVLGESADLGLCWGTPFYAGEFDETRRGRASGAVVMCTQHPAAALHAERDADPKLGDIMANIDAGYERAAHVLKELRSKRYVFVRRDEFKGREDYRDVTGRQLADEIVRLKVSKRCAAGEVVVVGSDTEGVPGKPWSIQVAFTPGTSYVLRYARDDFDVGVRALQDVADAGARILTHSFATPSGCGYDIARSREMGLRLRRVWDTMAGAWLLRLEPLGAKPLGLRYAGMRMASWEDTIGIAARDKQCEWLSQVLQRSWPKPEPQIEMDNAGKISIKNPWRIERRAEEFLYAAYVDGKDPYECWKQMNPVLKKQVEDVMRPMPIATLDDIALDDAIFYAARDADGGVRMYPHLHAELARFDKLTLMDEIMGTLPIFERMQAKGLPVSRRALEKVQAHLQTEMDKITYKLSREYMGGREFNPNSSKHVIALMTRRGLESAARTKKTKAPSIGKKGIEHLRFVDPAMALRQEWKESQHTKNAYCDSVLQFIPPDVDLFTLVCKVKPNATTTTRIATEDPNYLGWPKHDKPGGVDEQGNKRAKKSHGKMIRGCFIAPPGYSFLECDYRQIEVRVLGHESRDELLYEMFTKLGADGKERDVHRETAALVFGIKPADVDDTQRFLAKKVTFGIAYGTSGMGLADQLRMMDIHGYDADACDDFIREWLKLYKGAAKYFVEVEKAVKEKGWVEEAGGMRRYLLASRSRVTKLASEARRQAVNHRIQGFSQRLIQRAMIALDPKLERLREKGAEVDLLLQVHDALLLLVADKDLAKATKVITSTMVNEYGPKLRVPVTVDSKFAQSWGQL